MNHASSKTMSRVPGLLAVATAVFSCGLAAAAELHVWPDEVSIGPRSPDQRLVITHVDNAGFNRDVTAKAAVTAADPSLLSWSKGSLHSTASSKPADTTLTASLEGLTGQAKIHAIPAEAAEVSFDTEVVPILMRYGCNSGGCHGASRGKQGFRLSLFGFDPEIDHFRLTREFVNRRINLADPDDSLLLKKATNTVPHGGGRKISPDDPNFARLRQWIVEGATREPATGPKMTGVRVFPNELTLEPSGQTHSIVAIGDYSDGTKRDVTHLAILESSDPAVASVDPSGTVVSHSKGEVFLSVRLPAFITGVRVDVVPNHDLGQEYPQPFNFIDELVMARLKKLRILPSDLCDDRTFIRRVFIDTIGILPSREELTAFLADDSPTKRSALIDTLLAREEFVDLWTMKWMERLQARSIVSASASVQKATIHYNRWMREQIAAGVPVNQIFHDLIATSGTWIANPPTNFYRERDSKVLMENMSQLFLGARVQCAQCHNHPFDRWTQNDYYNFAAFFARVNQKKMEDPMDMFIYESATGEMLHPVSKKPMEPKFLGGDAPPTGDRDRRTVLADWLTSADNTTVARNLANIFWHHFFGVGIIDPVDDARISNPPSNPALLDALAGRLRESGFDQRSLIRDILNSRTYQLSAVPNETNAGDRRNYGRCLPRRPGAEVVWDTITQVTGSRPAFYMERPETRAVQIADGGVSNTFLTTFGRSSRSTPCTCEVKTQPTLAQALELVNGDTVSQAIERGGRMRDWLASEGSPQAAARRIFQTALARDPTAGELQAFEERLASTPDKPLQALEDTCWAVLNSAEFLFNH
jgi:hypothetical protein